MEGCHLVYTFFFVRSVAYLSLFLLAAGCQQSPEAISATNQISGGLQDQARVSVRVARAAPCFLDEPHDRSPAQGETLPDSRTRGALSLPSGTVLNVEPGAGSDSPFIKVIVPGETQSPEATLDARGGPSTCLVDVENLDARMTASKTTTLRHPRDPNQKCTLQPDEVVSFHYIIGNGLPGPQRGPQKLMKTNLSFIVRISSIEDNNGNDTSTSTCDNLHGQDALIHLADFLEAAWYERSPFVRH